MRYKLVDGTQIPMTAEEETARDIEETAWATGQSARDATEARILSLQTAINDDSVIQNIKSMTASQFDAWWDANVTNATQAIAVLKRIVKIIIFRLL